MRKNNLEEVQNWLDDPITKEFLEVMRLEAEHYGNVSSFEIVPGKTTVEQLGMETATRASKCSTLIEYSERESIIGKLVEPEEEQEEEDDQESNDRKPTGQGY